MAGGAPCPQQLPEGANGERTPNGQFTENTVLTQERQKGIFSLADVYRVYREYVNAQVS